HGELGSGHLQSGGERERATMHAVEAVAVRIGRDAGRAADAGDNDDLLRRQAQLRESPRERHEDMVVAAAGTPDRLDIGFIVGRLAGEPRVKAGHHDIDSVMARWISLLLIGSGPGLLRTRTSPGRS